jgi:hypothetical protein
VKVGRLLVFLAVLLETGLAHGWCRMTTSPRAPSASEPCIYPDETADPPEHYLVWERRCTAMALSDVALSADMTVDEVYGVLSRSMDEWERTTCAGAPLGVDMEILQDRALCEEPLYRDDGPNVNSMMFIADWFGREYDPAAFAVTTVWHRRSTGEILDVDLEVNEERGPYGICPADGCNDERTVDLENVVTHELGHYLGLAHSTEPDATMYASAVAGETLKRTLSEDDRQGICAVYPTGSPGGECDYTPRGGLELGCETGCSAAPIGASRTRPWWLLAALVLALWRRRGR